MLSVGKRSQLCQCSGMRIVCPECHAAYQVSAMIKNAILVCHRCNTEFDSYGNKVVEESEVAQILAHQQSVAPTFGISDLNQAGMKRKPGNIWLWLSLVLISLTTIGMILHWDTWQYNAYIRGYMISADTHAPILDSDWRIVPESVHSQWLKRDDGSIILIIEGNVENQLRADLPTPEIQISFMTQTGQNYTVIQPITEPPSLDTLKATPFVSPAIDKTMVGAFAQRGFILLLEETPRSSQQFTLHALAVQRQGLTQL